MAKRKSGVTDIVFELNNEDLEISSEDEFKDSKKSRLESDVIPISHQSDVIIEESSTDAINIDKCCSTIIETESKPQIQNGGKIKEEKPDFVEPTVVKSPIPNESDCKKVIETAKTTIFNEDIVVDSPSSNNYVNDFANRTPLMTVRFRDNKLASNYKEKIKAFMLKLIKLHGEENCQDSENETDLELDIWPEDCTEETDAIEENSQDNLYFVDTDPNILAYDEIPSYSKASTLITNSRDKETTPPPSGWKILCFNCDGAHNLRDCTLPRNNAKIAENRKQVQKVGRYHIEDEQKYGNLVPGRISGQLRHALGLKRHEIPMYIYRMRLLGYPPGWLEEAKISHSGITMFDSTGTAILDPEEEEGELCEPGCKDKFDIKKLLDYPGFNVPVSSRYKEEAHLFGLPPLSEQDSKLKMLQTLAPNAMKAYKRKKLTYFPSAMNKSSQNSQAEMELDSGDEQAVFPSVPPLPDEAPPPLPPPPPESPPLPPLPPPETTSNSTPQSESTPTLKSTPPSPLAKMLLSSDTPTLSSEKQPETDTPLATKSLINNKSVVDIDEHLKYGETTNNDNDAEVIKVMEVQDIPMQINDSIDDNETSNTTNCPKSPSLDDLESKKQLLLDALKGDKKDGYDVMSDEDNNDDKETDNLNNIIDVEMHVSKEDNDSDRVTKLDKNNDNITEESNSEVILQPDSDLDATGNKIIIPGGVKGTKYGTPVLNVASPFSKLPSDEKFAKNISEIINFENLPNYVGTYKRMSTLLKKVKSEVDRIQES